MSSRAPSDAATTADVADEHVRIGPVRLRVPAGSEVALDERGRKIWGHLALRDFLALLAPSSSILDVGSGRLQLQAGIMRASGFVPITTDLGGNVDFPGSYESVEFGREFDGIWCCHILEHALNPHDFLLKLRRDVRDGGLVAITVPTITERLLRGHVNLFNAGIVLYRMVCAGIDCSSALVSRYGANISVIVRVKKIEPRYPDASSLEDLAPFFPVPVCQRFNGDIRAVDTLRRGR